MHPDIKAHWEKFYGRKAYSSGDIWWICADDNPLSSSGRMIAIKYSGLKILDKAGKYTSFLSNPKPDDWVYPFLGGPRDEATMLRMLKLKAFL
jgi:hypothetical protein